MSFGFVSNMLNPSPDTRIDSLLNINTESTSLIDVLVTTFAEPPMLYATTLPPPPTPLITHLQKTPVPTPLTVPSSSLQDLPNFGSLFGIDHRLKTLENNFLEFNQTNQFTAVVSSIPGIVDAYVAHKMHEPIKTATVNEQLKAEVLTRSSNESKTSHAIAANLSELELNKILVDKMESNKTINRSDEQKNLYKALTKNPPLDQTGGPTKDELDSAPKEKTSKTSGKSYEGSKSKHKTADETTQTEEPIHTTKYLEEPAHQEFETEVTEDQPNEETPQFPDWFQRPAKLPTPDRDWNKTLSHAHGPVQPWLSSLAHKEDLRELFNELMDSPLNFSAFVMN
ncbi:hypothetical protein Tco_1436683 [Tanacetum coccineum]